MNMINAFSKAILICVGSVAGAGMLHAETISQDSGVTVVRGVDDARAAAQRQTSRGRSGVMVFRGENALPPAERPAMAMPAVRQVVGGETLWIYEPAENAVTACSLRYDFYGSRHVRCTTD